MEENTNKPTHKQQVHISSDFCYGWSGIAKHKNTTTQHEELSIQLTQNCNCTPYRIVQFGQIEPTVSIQRQNMIEHNQAQKSQEVIISSAHLMQESLTLIYL